MKNGGAIVLTRMLTDDRQTDIMITIPLLPRGKKKSVWICDPFERSLLSDLQFSKNMDKVREV